MPRKVELPSAVMPRRIAIVIVVVCVVLVVANVLGFVFLRNDVVARRKMEGMAREYYEDYYYAKVDLEKLEKYAVRGLPAVSLKVLLNYEDGKNAGEEGYFRRTKCNLVDTKVVFYPKEPYGPRDYEMKINYSCNFE